MNNSFLLAISIALIIGIIGFSTLITVLLVYYKKANKIKNKNKKPKTSNNKWAWASLNKNKIDIRAEDSVIEDLKKEISKYYNDYSSNVESNIGFDSKAIDDTYYLRKYRKKSLSYLEQNKHLLNIITNVYGLCKEDLNIWACHSGDVGYVKEEDSFYIYIDSEWIKLTSANQLDIFKKLEKEENKNETSN